MRRQQFGVLGVACAVAAAMLVPSVVMAQTCPNGQSCSSTYSVDEVYFGPGGGLNSTSTNYGADATIGDTAAGGTGNAIAGGQTGRDESLEFIVTNTGGNLGVLSAGSTKATTASFTVKSYISSGYVVTNAGDPPRSGNNTFGGITGTLSPSTPGTEQFGINLKDNSTPDVGAEAFQSPDSTFGSGLAAVGYNTANQYKYVKGEVIARANSSSGVTNYTVSYIFNINNLTRAGQYNFNHIMVATATY